jgi:membrane protease YdiL (CAAX protease family)
MVEKVYLYLAYYPGQAVLLAAMELTSPPDMLYTVAYHIRRMLSVKKLLYKLAFLAPYVTIPPGLFIFHSAWVALIAYHAVMILIMLVRHYRVSLGQVFNCRNILIIIGMAALGVAAGVAIYLLWPYLNISAGIVDELGSLGLGPGNWAIFLIYFVLVNPLLEELFWRGLLGSASLRPVWHDLAFAGYHAVVLLGKMEYYWLLPVLAALFLGAWLWRQVNRTAGSLLPGIIAHAAADFSVMLAVFVLLFA